ncbi:hypothetical protein [Halosimplex sp. TS25]|uniref:hypothetical protein n=1 Tax=Halosimplex rarum TaxID=3396619 RepID=UPI0039EA5975
MLLQISPFVRAEPAWLPAAAIFFGIQLVLTWYFGNVVGATAAGQVGAIPSRERTVIVGSLVVGYLCIATALVRQYASVGLLSMYLLFLAKVIEGVASLRFVKKAVDFLAGGGSGSGSLRGVLRGLLPRLKFKFLAAFIALVGFSLVAYVITSDPVVRGRAYDVALIYTLMSFAIAVVGATYRLRAAPSTLNTTGKAGIIFCLAGAAIYDYQSLAGEVVSFMVGTVGYSIGFWIAAIVLVGVSSSALVGAVRSVTPF